MTEMKIAPQSGDFAMRELTPEEMNEIAGGSKKMSWAYQVIAMVNDIVNNGVKPTSIGYDADQNLVIYTTK
jgi:hypothetical protein